jgi:anti-sigma B factor antagonist
MAVLHFSPAELFAHRTFQPTPQTYVVSLSGDLDVYTAPVLKTACQNLSTTIQHVILDLDHVEFIDSSGMGGIVSVWRKNRQAGLDTQVVTSQPLVLRRLQITQLDRVIRVCSSLNEALS